MILRAAAAALAVLAFSGCMLPADIRERPSESEGNIVTGFEYYPVVVSNTPPTNNGVVLLSDSCESTTFRFVLKELPDPDDLERSYRFSVRWFVNWEDFPNQVCSGWADNTFQECTIYWSKHVESLEDNPGQMYFIEADVSDLGFKRTDEETPRNRAPMDGAHSAQIKWMVRIDSDLPDDFCP